MTGVQTCALPISLEGREGTIDTFEVMKEDALAHGGVIATPHRPSAGAGSLDPRA